MTLDNSVSKVVDGVTYQAVRHENRGSTCVGCAGYTNTDRDLCDELRDAGCNFIYIFKCAGAGPVVPNVGQGHIPPRTIPEPEIVTFTKGVKYDSDKLQYSLIPPYALEAVAQNLTDGLKKYPERNNWAKVSNAQERYMDALYRHLEAHRKGEIYDTDNVNPENTHMAAVVANAMFLLEFMLNPELKGNK